MNEVHISESAEVRSMPDMGGGRGVFATRDIKPGEVVFSEAPLVPQAPPKSEEEAQEELHMQIARRILQRPPAERRGLIGEMAPLYPRTLDELQPQIRETATEKYSEDVAALLDAAGKAGFEELPEAPEVLRLVLQVVFNAFEGGLYIRKAMLNHCCRPNCMTFQTGQRVRADGSAVAIEKSEVVATQLIAAGAEITISYLVPVEQSHATRSRKWEAQHLCPLQPSPWPAELEQFRVPKDGPFDAEGAQEDLQAIEEDLDALEEQLDFEQVPPHPSRTEWTRLVHPSVRIGHDFEQIRPREALEVLAKFPVAELLHPRHLTACRVHNVMVKCAQQLAPPNKPPKAADIITVLRASLEVRETLLLGWPGPLGKDHCEVARVQCDVHAALDFLVNNHREALEAALPERFGSWQKSSKAEYAARREYLRISKMYD